MTASEWAACADPEALLRTARQVVSDRKFRLFAAACWFHTWADQFPAARPVVELFVRYADGLIPAAEWPDRFAAAGGVYLGRHVRQLVWADALRVAVESAEFAARDVATRRAWEAVEIDAHAPIDRRAAQLNRRSRVRDRALADEQAAQAGLVREVLGYPFAPLDFAPWRTDTAVALARNMYDANDFGATPILADALQDAGCDREEVLNHCRGEGRHVRGCWVVDGVLGWT